MDNASCQGVYIPTEEGLHYMDNKTQSEHIFRSGSTDTLKHSFSATWATLLQNRFSSQ